MSRKHCKTEECVGGRSWKRKDGSAWRDFWVRGIIYDEESFVETAKGSAITCVEKEFIQNHL